ncbi:hypothetical protein VNO80_03036 [Phaseolus coccineus]|uniref:Uncharacterized protein n=1 Tax=Phaseolus coccineus TaxID=3886 RepID=A0AAN9NVB7_PHACN
MQNGHHKILKVLSSFKDVLDSNVNKGETEFVKLIHDGWDGEDKDEVEFQSDQEEIEEEPIQTSRKLGRPKENASKDNNKIL